MKAAVEVKGLGDLNKALKGVDKELPKEMRLGLKAIAQRFIPDVASKVPVLTGKLSGSLKAGATAKSASVSTSVLYAGFIEFGGSVGRKKAVKRQFVQRGRYIFPEAQRQKDSIETQIVALVDTLTEKAGLT